MSLPVIPVKASILVMLAFCLLGCASPSPNDCNQPLDFRQYQECVCDHRPVCSP